jgi:chaperonin GroES
LLTNLHFNPKQKINFIKKGGDRCMKVKPLGDRVLVKPIEEKEVKRGNIIIPDTAKEKPQQGEVIAVGKGKVTEDGKVIPMEVKVGDKVLYGKYSGTEIKIDGVEYLILHQDDIMGIIEE